MNPSSHEVRAELVLLDDAIPTSDMDEVFLAGVRRALEWTQGVGVSPTEFLKMCQRVPRVH